MGALKGTRTRLVIFACLVITGYFAYTAAAGWIRNQQLAEDRAAAEQRVRELEGTQAYLEAVKNYVASDAYVEQEARRQLGFIREGEIPFVVTSPPPQTGPERSGTWWERLFPR
jgi:cell division protein FtsB